MNMLAAALATVIVKSINVAENPDNVSSTVQYVQAKKALIVNVGGFQFNWFMLVAVILLFASHFILYKTRFGLRLRLPAAYHNVSYLGRGPEENYWDRKTGSPIGRYTTTAERMYFPYVRPQENGHRTDVRQLSLTDDRGRGLCIIADKTLEFNALRNSIEDFDSAESPHPVQINYYDNHDVDVTGGRRQTHVNDIVPRDFVELCLDEIMMGVGGDNSWGAPINPKYLIDISTERHFGFTVVPIK